MLELQIIADRADLTARPGLEDAIAILVEQQRLIREMVEDMSGEMGTKVAIAPVLEALAMRWRQAGRRLSWSVTPSDAMLAGHDDLRFHLDLLDALRTIRSTAVAVEVRAGATIEVSISEGGAKLAEYSMEVAT